MVWVGPPLSARGPSSGSIGDAEVPIRLPLASGDPTGAATSAVPVLSPIRLCWAETVLPLPGDKSGDVPLSVFCARIVLVSVIGPSPLTWKIPPPTPDAAWFCTTVLFVTVTVPPEKIAPPLAAEPAVREFPDSVLFVTVNVPTDQTAPPPEPAELPDRVLLVTTSTLAAKIAPPSPVAKFPDSALFVTVVSATED